MQAATYAGRHFIGLDMFRRGPPALITGRGSPVSLQSSPPNICCESFIGEWGPHAGVMCLNHLACALQFRRRHIAHQDAQLFRITLRPSSTQPSQRPADALGRCLYHKSVARKDKPIHYGNEVLHISVRLMSHGPYQARSTPHLRTVLGRPLVMVDGLAGLGVACTSVMD
jgi:hypothetical protein